MLRTHKCIAVPAVGGGTDTWFIESNGWQARDVTADPILDVRPFTAVLTALASVNSGKPPHWNRSKPRLRRETFEYSSHANTWDYRETYARRKLNATTTTILNKPWRFETKNSAQI